MSLQSHGDPQEMECPHCGNSEIQLVSRNVNATTFPKYRAQIMDGTFHHARCSSCAEAYFIDVPLHYCDFDRSEWIMMYPLAWEPEWSTYANDVNVVLEAAFRGPDSPPAFRDDPPGMWVRAVFGLPALREKLVLHEAGVDDVVLEAFKLKMLLGTEGAGPVPEARPRCVLPAADALIFSMWTGDGDTPTPNAVSIKRADFDAAEKELLRHPGLLDQLRATPYVDVGSILYPQDPPVLH